MKNNGHQREGLIIRECSNRHCARAAVGSDCYCRPCRHMYNMAYRRGRLTGKEVIQSQVRELLPGSGKTAVGAVR